MRLAKLLCLLLLMGVATARATEVSIGAQMQL
jgi:hypothetical protein